MNIFSISMYKKLNTEEIMETLFLIEKGREAEEYEEILDSAQYYDLYPKLLRFGLNLAYILNTYNLELIITKDRTLFDFLNLNEKNKIELIDYSISNVNANREVKNFFLNDKTFEKICFITKMTESGYINGFQLEAVIKLVMIVFGYNNINCRFNSFMDYYQKIEWTKQRLIQKNPKWQNCEEDLTLIFDILTNRVYTTREVKHFKQELKLLYGIEGNIEYTYDGIMNFLKGENK